MARGTVACLVGRTMYACVIITVSWLVWRHTHKTTHVHWMCCDPAEQVRSLLSVTARHMHMHVSTCM